MTCAEKIKRNYRGYNQWAASIRDGFKVSTTEYDSLIVIQYTFVDGSEITFRYYFYA